MRYFANLFWIHTSGPFQKNISRIFSSIFSLKLSRLFILPYCLFFALDSEYLDQFESESGESTYFSYGDFFRRKFRMPPLLESSVVWPVEGYICDWGSFAEKNNSVVKGQCIDLNSIFSSDPLMTADYYFVNVFLHNHNYHRVHSPINGTISKITSIPGDLVFLRPWFYKRNDVSYPAFRNERVIYEIKDDKNRPWYVAMVGGFGVGTIESAPTSVVGAKIVVGQEISKFNMGSTVCIASPQKIETQKFLQKVSVGLNMSSNV